MNMCGCSLAAADPACEEGQRLWSERDRAWTAWYKVAGIPQSNKSLHATYVSAAICYRRHVDPAYGQPRKDYDASLL